jgi:pimeloyl-ACP methyl ester carboxylesterase
MAISPLNDIIVLIPGITGSVLKRGDDIIWPPLGRGLLRMLRDRDWRLEAMVLENEDPERDLLDDRITPVAVADDVHMIPGLWKIEGYTALRKQLHQSFDITSRSAQDRRPPNYFEFFYDWRRDNHYSAVRLKRYIEERLKLHKAGTSVIIIAHSMGGLIARYYLEVLGGAELCRALFTFGSPYKGSINSLDTLANGYKALFIPLFKNALRTFTSLYQLIPHYRTVFIDGKYHYPTAIQGVPGVDPELVQRGSTFLTKLLDAIETNSSPRPYDFVPFVGRNQRTRQSIALADGRLTARWKDTERPEDVLELYSGGDGTVPLISATVPGVPTFATSAPHSGIHNRDELVSAVIRQIIDLQHRQHLESIRDLPRSDEPAQAGIALEVDDAYAIDESITLRATVVNSDRRRVSLSIEPLQSSGATRKLSCESGEPVVIEGLASGLYRVRARVGPNGPKPVTDVFEVID